MTKEQVLTLILKGRIKELTEIDNEYHYLLFEGIASHLKQKRSVCCIALAEIAKKDTLAYQKLLDFAREPMSQNNNIAYMKKASSIWILGEIGKKDAISSIMENYYVDLQINQIASNSLAKIVENDFSAIEEIIGVFPFSEDFFANILAKANSPEKTSFLISNLNNENESTVFACIKAIGITKDIEAAKHLPNLIFKENNSIVNEVVSTIGELIDFQEIFDIALVGLKDDDFYKKSCYAKILAESKKPDTIYLIINEELNIHITGNHNPMEFMNCTSALREAYINLMNNCPFSIANKKQFVMLLKAAFIKIGNYSTISQTINNFENISVSLSLEEIYESVAIFHKDLLNTNPKELIQEFNLEILEFVAIILARCDQKKTGEIIPVAKKIFNLLDNCPYEPTMLKKIKSFEEIILTLVMAKETSDNCSLHTLKKLLPSDDNFIICLALEILKQTKDHETALQISMFLFHEEESVRKAAARALEKINDKKIIEFKKIAYDKNRVSNVKAIGLKRAKEAINEYLEHIRDFFPKEKIVHIKRSLFVDLRNQMNDLDICNCCHISLRKPKNHKNTNNSGMNRTIRRVL